MPMHIKKYLTRKQASEHLRGRGLPCGTASLAKMALIGSGPPIVRWGRRRVLYETEALESWASGRLATSFAREHEIKNVEEPSHALKLSTAAEESI
jgi:hypothetical protein